MSLGDFSLTIDWSGIEEHVSGVLVEALRDFVVADVADLKVFGLGIAKDMIRAHLTGDTALHAETIAQARGLLEVNRIRLNGVEWSVAEKTITLVFKAAAAALKGFLPIP